MVERDLTTGELGIKLDSLLTQLQQIRTEMFTTSLFSAWRDGNEARLARIELDQKEWARVSTQAHADLAARTERAVALDKAEREKLAVVLRAEIKTVSDALALALEEQEKIKEKQEARRYDLVKAIGLSLLVAILGVISSLAIILIKGGFPDG